MFPMNSRLIDGQPTAEEQRALNGNT